ncbi:MAG: PEGA domain-containing protein [Bacteroidota bacterium]|jgi:uncharacterized protein YceK
MLQKLPVQIALFVLIIPMLQGCATILTGTTDRVNINSSPSNADVFIYGEHKGKTPLILELPKDKNYQLLVSKTGFDTTVANITYSCNYWWLVADIPLSIIPASGVAVAISNSNPSPYFIILWITGSILDFITGKIYHLDQKDISVNLIKSEKQIAKLVEQMTIDSFKESSKINTEQDKAYILIHSQIPFLRFDSNRKIDQVNQLSSGDWEVWLPAGTHILKITADGFQRLELPPMNFGKKRSYEMTIKVDTSTPEP